MPAVALSQAPQAASAGTPQAAPIPQAAPAPQIRTGAQLVLVDVVVQDSAGHPVRHLPREAFHISEGKAAQTLSAFEEHSDANPVRPGMTLAPMPPGTFTNYTPVPDGGALNVLLVDALNTAMPEQGFVRNQLKDFVNKVPPGTRIAIFGLSTRLYMLQGFTSDIATLKRALNNKLLPRASVLMDNAMSGAAENPVSDAATDAGFDSNLVANIQQFEAMGHSAQMANRVQDTADAFNALAHYLSAFPGRKNLLWFSGGFPLNVFPDMSLLNPFAVVQSNSEEVRQTTDLLARAEVSVYPIDAHGLTAIPALSAANSKLQNARASAAMVAAFTQPNDEQAQTHFTMEQIASDSGGHAFYNTNGLAGAASAAIAAGSSYYTLAYRPLDRDNHGEYRTIHVDLSGPGVPMGLKLAYRHGYFADDLRHAAASTAAVAAKAAAGGDAFHPGAGSLPAQVYRRTAMAHGGPTPQDLLFKVRVLPASTTTTKELSPGEIADPGGASKGPYRLYDLDFAALGKSLQLNEQPNGDYTGAVECVAFVYNSDGKLLNLNAKTVQINLKPATYKRFITSGTAMHLQVSAPALSEAYLRIALHDVTADHYGVVEIPTSAVSRLAPASPVSTTAPAHNAATPDAPK